MNSNSTVMKNTTIILLLLLSIIPISCREKDTGADAWGNFEATETMISSESGGKVIYINAREGSIIEKGDIVAVIDTIMPHLQRIEIEAGISAISAKAKALRSQNNVISQQVTNLDVNIERTEKMLSDQAATQKQLDDLTGQKSVLLRQAEANNSQAAATETEISVMKARLLQIEEQISRCYVKSPASGTILTRYTEEGEITAQGKPLVKIADLNTMKLKAWVSGAQLGLAQPGAICSVRVDEGEKGYRYYEGLIATISPKAEFTPKIIQTKDERVNLVYGVTIEVKNDGFIRTGMPGEVIFIK